MKLLKRLATNKTGSEVVEKIFMVVLSVAIAGAAVSYIWSVLVAETTGSTSGTDIEAPTA